jgi:hypothetical protein
MDKKDIAKMLFKMHLKPKPTGKELWRYNDYNFTKLISFAEDTEMEDTQRIAWAYPNHEFVARFTNGDVVIFETEGRDLHARKVLTGIEAARLMAEVEDDPDTWMEMDEIYIPEATEIYGAPL